MPHRPIPKLEKEARKNAENIVMQKGGEIIDSRRSSTNNATLITSVYVSTVNPDDPLDCWGSERHYGILYVISDEGEDIGNRAAKLAEQRDDKQNQIVELSLSAYLERGAIEKVDKQNHLRAVLEREEPTAQAAYQEGYERDMQQWFQGLSDYMSSGDTERRRESLRARYPRASEEELEFGVTELYLREHPKPKEWKTSQERGKFIEKTEKTAMNTYRISDEASDRIRELEERQAKHETQLCADVERIVSEIVKLEKSYGFKVSDLK